MSAWKMAVKMAVLCLKAINCSVTTYTTVTFDNRVTCTEGYVVHCDETSRQIAINRFTAGLCTIHNYSSNFKARFPLPELTP